MKLSIKIMLILLLYNSIAYGQTLQNVMDNGNRTTDIYSHKNTVYNGNYILVDTPYVFTTDYYTPTFVLSYHSDSAINVNTPTGSPIPQNAEGDHVWDLGINIDGNSGLNNIAHGSIGIQWESLYWGGLSSVIPAQEFHLYQNYNSGGAQRFLTYAGLEDGTNSQLALNARSINLGDGTMTVNLCSQGNNTGGMTVVNTSVNMYAPVLSSNYATFGDFLTVTGTNAYGGGEITINSGSGTMGGQAALTINSNGTYSPALINVSATGTNDDATITASTTGTAADATITASASDGDVGFYATCTASAHGATYVAYNDLNHLTYYGISGSTNGRLPDEGYLISTGLNGLAVFTQSNSPILFSTNNSAYSSTAYDMQINTSHNVLIANTEDIGGNAVVTGFVSASKLKITTGTNANAGSATLSGGAVTVSTTAVTSSSLVFLSVSNSSSPGFLSYSTVAGTSFTVTSTSAGDGSTVSWLIVN